MKRQRVAAGTLCLVVLSAACGDMRQEASDRREQEIHGGAVESQHENIAKVKVDRAGRIYLNGRQTTIETLRKELARLAASNGVVWYHREDRAGEPPPAAMAVIKAITDARVPVKLMEEDF